MTENEYLNMLLNEHDEEQEEIERQQQIWNEEEFELKDIYDVN